MGLLREVPIAFTPEGTQYRFTGMTTTGALIESLIGASYALPETRVTIHSGDMGDTRPF